MPEPQVKEVEPGVFLIDQHFQGVPGVIASYLLADGDDLALVEAGPSSTSEALLAGVRAAGFQPERIAHILLTHIHLDHAGAAGSLARRLPHARVYVHPLGAPHLLDPSRLLASAGRIYGERMGPLWGDFLPVPEEKLVVLHDGQELRAGGRTLRALDTPGHANHHFAYHCPESGSVFTGDVAGVRIGGLKYLRPPTPPPDLELDAWRESLRKLRALRAERFHLTHFGTFTDLDWHLDELIARLFHWAGWLEARLAAEPDTTALAAEMRRQGDAELAALPGASDLADPYELATNYQMSVDGFARYFRKRRTAEGVNG